MWSFWWSIPVSIIAAFALIWLVLAVSLWLTKPDDVSLRDVAQLLPDLLRLLKRLATDPEVPRGVRVRLFLLIAFVASPIDLIPDFIPVLGIVDDVIIVAFVLRSVGRRAGPAVLARHWAGTQHGLSAVLRLCGVPPVNEGNP